MAQPVAMVDLVSETPFNPTALKAFLTGPSARAARHHLSSSFCEPLSLQEMMVFDPTLLDSLTRQSLGYTEPNGSADLRTRIADYLGLESGKNVVLTNGADQALEWAILALVAPDMRVILPTPCYPPQAHWLRRSGARIYGWPGAPSDGRDLPLEGLDRLSAHPPTAMVLTIPGNPTGFIGDAAWRDGLVSFAHRHAIRVIADEVYRGLPGDMNIAPYCRIDPHGISIGSFSKVFGLPGLRLGWIASQDKYAMDRIRAVAALASNFASAPSEAIASAALSHSDAILTRNAGIAKIGRAALETFLARHRHLFAGALPAAGVNAWLSWKGPGGTDDLSHRLLEEAGLVLAHEGLFGQGHHHVRIGFGTRATQDNLDAFTTALQTLGYT